MTNTPPEVEIDIPMAIRMARARRGLTKEAWAGEVGIHPSAIGRFESGERSPSARILADMAAAAGVALSEMLRWGEPV